MTTKTADDIAVVAFVAVAFAISQPAGWAALVIAAAVLAWRERVSR